MNTQVYWNNQLVDILSYNEDGTYDIIMNQERNIPFESVLVDFMSCYQGKPNIKSGDEIIYRKQSYFYRVIVDKIDWAGCSFQVRMIYTEIPAEELWSNL